METKNIKGGKDPKGRKWLWRVALVVILLGLVTHISVADYVQYPTEWNISETYNISGYVKDTGGSPIVDVLVESNITFKSNTTNTLGYYKLGLINNTYKITASKTGYIDNYTIVTVSGSDLTNQNITMSQISLAPNITGWWNNYTNDNLTSFVVGYAQEANRTILFNVTANQSIDYWVWFKDDILVQNSSSDNYTATWDFGGSYTIKVYGINVNGQTSTLVWNIKIQNTLYEQNLLLLEENEMIGTTILFTFFGVFGFVFLLLGLFRIAEEYYMDIILIFASGVVFLLLGYQCYISDALLEFEFASLLLIVMGVIIFIFGIIRIVDVAMNEFGMYEREEDRDSDYEYK